jgi:hypothetical protein
MYFVFILKHSATDQRINHLKWLKFFILLTFEGYYMFIPIDERESRYYLFFNSMMLLFGIFNVLGRTLKSKSLRPGPGPALAVSQP